MEDKVYFTTYNGKRILIEDFTHLKPGPEFTNRIEFARNLIASQPQNSVLAVFDATGVMFNSEILNAMKEFTKANTPYIKASCVVGVSGMLQVGMTAVSKFSGRNFVSFQTREQALEWLCNQ